MDPVTMGLIGTGGQILTGAIGDLLAGKDRAEQLRILRGIQQEYGDIEIPELQKLEAEQLGDSAMGRIQSDPSLRQAQMDSLDELQRIYRSGGMTLEDKANLANIRERQAVGTRGAREKIREDMAMRGTGGSGAEMVMNLRAQSDAANRAGREGLETAAMAQKRALDAMLARGRMAGDVRGQEFGESSAKAQAADAVARYNAASRERAGQFNAEQPYRQFGAQMQKTNAKAGASRDVADYYGGQADDERKRWAGYGKAAYEGATGFGGGKK